MTCRCNSPPACSRNICIRATRPACSTSRIWARSRCARNPARSRTPRWRWSGWCRRISLRSRRDRQRYAQFTNAAGGILDDLMVANFGDHLFLVVNAACKADDEAHLRAHLSDICDHRAAGRSRADRAAGAEGRIGAGETLPRSSPRCASWMPVRARSMGIDCFVSRSGYTGEDGFEISVPAEQAEALAMRCWTIRDVLPIGLGARDSLRLEAGLCLYGHDIDTTTTPVEGALEWSIQKSRRNGGARAGGFPGADVILDAIRTRRAAPPRRPEAGRPRAGARERAAVRRRNLVASRSARSPRAASARASMRRSRWAMCRSSHAATGTRCIRRCARRSAAAAGRRHALRSHPTSDTSAEDSS